MKKLFFFILFWCFKSREKLDFIVVVQFAGFNRKVWEKLFKKEMCRIKINLCVSGFHSLHAAKKGVNLLRSCKKPEAWFWACDMLYVSKNCTFLPRLNVRFLWKIVKCKVYKSSWHIVNPNILEPIFARVFTKNSDYTWKPPHKSVCETF